MSYLASFNFTAFILWILFLSSYLISNLQLNYQNLIFLNAAQGLALLEIMHVLLNWVKSPLMSTAVQVVSRLLVLLLIDAYALNYFEFNIPKSTFLNTGVFMALFAWSLTEIIRYSLYFLAIFKLQPQWLLWMRYSFFILLYPFGVVGEWLIFIFLFVPQGISLNLNTAIIFVILIAYSIFFPQLYSHMWRQRKLKLN